MTIKRLIKISISGAILVVLGGCAVFPHNKFSPVDNFSQLGNQVEPKPSVYINYRKFIGIPGENVNQLPVSQIENELVANLLVQSKMFSDVIYDEYEKDKADITLNISEYQFSRENRAVTLLKVLVGGFSLMLIPISGDVEISTNIQAIDKGGNVIYEHSNEDGATVWIGLFMAPFGYKAVPNWKIESNLIQNDLQALSKSKKLVTMGMGQNRRTMPRGISRGGN